MSSDKESQVSSDNAVELDKQNPEKDEVKVEKQSPDSPKESGKKEEKPAQSSGKKQGMVTFRSIRKEFTCCVSPPKITEIEGVVTERRPARNIKFANHTYTTAKQEEIDFLRKLIASDGTDSHEVFELPEADELLQGNVTDKLEGMNLSELRQVANERGVPSNPNYSEVELRYEILKKLTGIGEKKK